MQKKINISEADLPKGGEMGELIRAKDWSETLAGPIDVWPQNLCLALDICLKSSSPISIYWGEGLTLFYNDAWKELIGDESLLGQTARDIFKNDWQVIGPELKQVLSSGDAANFHNQFLSLAGNKEGYFNFSFSPISGEEGPGGIFSIATETTKQVRTEKRRKHIEKALQIGTVGVAFFNLEGQITEANDAFLQMSGFSRKDLETGKLRWDEITPPEWMQTTEKAINELRETGANKPYEKQYYRKDGSRWWALFSAKHLEDGNNVEFVLDITDRKRTEKLQDEQKRLLELVASGAPLDECLSSLCSAISKLNSGVRAAILLADNQQETFERPIAPDLPDSFNEGLNGVSIVGTCGEAIYTGKPAACTDIKNDEKWSKEWRDICLSHNILASHSEPIFNKGGTAMGAFMLCFDKSSRKANEWEKRLVDFGTHIAGIAIESRRNEEAIRQSEEKYRTLFNSIDEGFCIIKMIFDDAGEPVDYLFLQANPAFEKQSGLEQVEGKTMRQLIPGHEDYWFEIYGKVALTGESKRFESYTEKLNRWLNLYAFRIDKPEERKVAVIFNDISDRKKSQKEREQLLKQVETERERLSDVFQQAPSIMAVLEGPNHVFEQANEGYRQFVPNRDLIGKKVREVFPELVGQGFFKLLDQVYQTGERYVGKDVRVMLEPKSGGPREEHYFNFVYQPIHNSEGAVTGIFVQGVNLTERKQVEKKLKAMNETLEERVEERTASLMSYQEQLRSLASRLSKAEEHVRQRLAAELHDNLGQILAVGKMKVDLLQKSSLSDEVATDVGEVKELVEEALTYTRLLMSDLKPPPSLDKEDIRATIQWLAKKMKKHDLKVTLIDDGQPKQVSEEIRTTLLQGVRELLFNIVKHSGANEARIFMSHLDNRIEIIVEDQGKGFNPEANRPIASEEGGFGLFNIHERMDLIGGTMNISSTPGKGTRVKLMVPLKVGNKPQKPEGSEDTESTQKVTKTKEKVKVLLVDDHEMMREGLRKIVNEQDDLLVIAEASDGKEAVKLALEASPDIVVMDVNMPRMDGIEATQEIMSKKSSLRVIGLSLHDHENVIESMREAGASAYLTKNEAFETLCATIRSEAALAKGE